MNCPKCNSVNIIRNGFDKGRQRYKCKDCKKRFWDTKVSKSKNKTMGISINDFRKKHDVVYILSQVFADIEASEESVLYEKSDIIKMANISPGYPGISTVLDSENFKKHRGRAGSTDYWSKVKIIDELKKEGVMR